MPAPVGTALFRKSQLPLQSQDSDHTVVFRTKCELVVELIREQARITGGRHLGIFDGAYALRSVVPPLVQPEPGHPRIEFLTRLRPDARLYALPPPGCRANQKWGRRLPPPCQGGRWSGPWQEGEGFILWSAAACPLEGTVCLWWVAGAEVPVKVVVAEVEGYRQRLHLVGSATELTGVEMVEGFAGRFRQEDVFRDLKQRLGWEECRAWTQAPIKRTSQVQGDAEPAAVGSVPVGGRRLHGLVVASALESEEGPAQCAGRGAAAATAWLGDPEPAGEMAGQGGGSGPGTGGGSGWGAGGGPVPGRLVQRSGHFPRNRGEMRGRQPEEAELDMIT